jgi:hypothetical protein
VKKRKAFESPRWRASQYEYRVSPTLKFTLSVDKYPYAMAHVGLPSESSYACYTVLPLSCVRSEQVYLDECERLAAQYPAVSALLAFVERLHAPKPESEEDGDHDGYAWSGGFAENH